MGKNIVWLVPYIIWDEEAITQRLPLICEVRYEHEHEVYLLIARKEPYAKYEISNTTCSEAFQTQVCAYALYVPAFMQNFNTYFLSKRIIIHTYPSMTVGFKPHIRHEYVCDRIRLKFWLPNY